MNNEPNSVNIFHGTDKKLIESIKSNGFRKNENDEHWLGQGIYFFLTYEEAEEWTRKRTRFGNKNIKAPAVIQAKVKYDKEIFIDTRNISDYKNLLKYYDEFHSNFFSEGGQCRISCSISKNKLRCIFFDWLQNKYGFKIFIAGFKKETFRKDKQYKQISESFSIPFIEYQMCVCDEKLITDITSIVR